MFNIYKPQTFTFCKYIKGDVLNKTLQGCDHGDCVGCPYKLSYKFEETITISKSEFDSLIEAQKRVKTKTKIFIKYK
jgi:hypothetical protein